MDGSLLDDSFGLLCDYIHRSSHLTEIDVSFNKLRPESFSRLLDILADNHHLMYLNLSFNMLLEDQRKLEKLGPHERNRLASANS